MTAANDLTEWRRNRGMSLRGLAKEIGISASMLARAEAGEGVAPATQKKIADHRGCLVTDIWPIDEPKAAA